MHKKNTKYWIRFTGLAFYGLFPIWSAYARTAVKDTLFYPIFVLFVLFIFDIVLELIDLLEEIAKSITNRYLDGRAVMNCAETTAAKVDEVVMKMLKEAYAKAVTYIRENMDILDEAAEFLIQRETITGKEFMEIFNKYKNPVEESDKNVSETDENDAEISEAEVKTDSEIKTEEENTSTYNTGYAQWVEDDDDEE